MNTTLKTDNLKPITGDRPAGCPAVSVIICAKNEEQNLPHVLPKIPDWVDEIILVDGHSTDKTIEVAKQFCPRIKVLHQQDKGKGNAIRLGTKEAKGEIIVMLDADGSTDPLQITDFINPLLNGYDFAKGSRFLEHNPVMPKIRIWGNTFFTGFTNFLFKTQYTDLCAGFNAFWKNLFSTINANGNTFLDEPTMNIRLKKKGLKVKEVFQQDTGRISGRANEGIFIQGFRILCIIILERFYG